MWWAIGVGALVLIGFLLWKFRNLHQRVQLAEVGKQVLFQHFQILKGPEGFLDRSIDPRVWHDPYMLGYCQGYLTILMASSGVHLTTLHKGMVGHAVFGGLAGDKWREVSDRIFSLYQQGDPEFQRGMTNGSDVAALIGGRAGPDLLADPEVQEALRAGPEYSRFMEGITGPSKHGPTGAAGAVLMQTYMERHKVEAGY